MTILKKKLTRLIPLFTLCITLLISGCGFQLRNSNDIPPKLRTLYFKSTNPYSQLSTRLQNLFKSLDVNLAKSPQNATIGLYVTKSTLTHSNPNIISTSYAQSYAFTLDVSAKLVNNRTGNIIAQQGFTATRSLLLNANQIYTSSSAGRIKRELNRDMTSMFYHWLTSGNIRTALNTKDKPHATSTKTTRRSP